MRQGVAIRALAAAHGLPYAHNYCTYYSGFQRLLNLSCGLPRFSTNTAPTPQQE
jgi:hypothetical protein